MRFRQDSLSYIPSLMFIKTSGHSRGHPQRTYYPRMSIDSLLSLFFGYSMKQTLLGSIEGLLSIFMKYPKKASKRFLQRIHCLYAFDLFQKFNKINQEIHRGLIVHIPEISSKSSRVQKELDPDVHRRLLVYIPSSMSIES